MLRQTMQQAAYGLDVCLKDATRKWLHICAPCVAALGTTMPSPTKLSAIVNMDKMLQRNPEQITALWQEVSMTAAAVKFSFHG